MRYFAKAPRYFAIPRNLSFTYENELNQNLFWMMLEYDRLKVLFLLNFLTLFNIVLASIENNELRELTTNDNDKKKISLYVRNNDVGC